MTTLLLWGASLGALVGGIVLVHRWVERRTAHRYLRRHSDPPRDAHRW